MESKHKNALIGGLLAIVFIMAVGFAGFTQQLTITDQTTVTSDWNIGFESATANAACGDTVTTNCGTVQSFTAQARSISFNTSFASPGQTVTYTVIVKNYGNVNAEVTGVNLVPTKSASESVITYSSAGIAAGDTLAPDAEKEFTVTVTFPQTDNYIEPAKMQNSMTMTIDWQEA